MPNVFLPPQNVNLVVGPDFNTFYFINSHLQLDRDFRQISTFILKKYIHVKKTPRINLVHQFPINAYSYRETYRQTERPNIILNIIFYISSFRYDNWKRNSSKRSSKEKTDSITLLKEFNQYVNIISHIEDFNLILLSNFADSGSILFQFRFN